ncbi:MAG: Holliday junction resolvase RuvX [Pseudomonadota bacterium]
MTDSLFLNAAQAFGTKGALLGLDVGERTIGLASCDPMRRVATPIKTLRRTKLKNDAKLISDMVAERHVVGLVIGLPLNMDGSEGPRAQSTRAIGARLKQFVGLPIAYWDERLSTVAMERALIAIDVSRSTRAETIDAAAANFILQGAIDRLRAAHGSD